MKFCDAVNGTISVLSRRDWKALDVLHALLMDFHVQGRVFYEGQWITNLRMYERPEMIYTSADDVKVMFWGGPPKDMKYYEATLMEYLLDQCLRYVVLGDPDRILFRFLEQTVEQANYKDIQRIKASAP